MIIASSLDLKSNLGIKRHIEKLGHIARLRKVCQLDREDICLFFSNQWLFYKSGGSNYERSVIAY